jgi:hypothetical protein
MADRVLLRPPASMRDRLHTELEGRRLHCESG